MRKRMTVLVVLAIAVAVSPVHAGTFSTAPDNHCEDGRTETIHYAHPGFGDRLVYHFAFDESQQLLCVNVKNIGENPESGGYNVIIDNRGLETPRPELEPGEKLSVTHNVSQWLGLIGDNHTVSVGARGNNTKFTFTRKVNASNPDVPSPQITDVDVLRYEKNDSTALLVSTYNPTKRPYGFYVQTETFGTKGEFRIGAPAPNQTDRILLPLEESPDEVIAGKVRIFYDWGVSEGKYDQKEFMSKPNESVNSWDVSFDRVPGTVDEYDYHNESAAKYREGYVDDDALPPLQKKIGAALVVLLPAVALWMRRRRKHR